MHINLQLHGRRVASLISPVVAEHRTPIAKKVFGPGAGKLLSKADDRPRLARRTD